MRILHIIHRYYPARGGAEMHLEKLSNYLAAAGHEVQVVTTDALDFELFWDPNRQRVKEQEGHHKGVAVRRYPIRHLPMSALAFPVIRRALWHLSTIKPLPLSWLHRLSRFAPWVPGLQEWADVETRPFDLVGAMTITFDPLFEAGHRLANRQGIPFVAFPLSSDQTLFNPLQQLIDLNSEFVCCSIRSIPSFHKRHKDLPHSNDGQEWRAS